MKFEVTVLTAAGVERAKAFYRGLGWRLHAQEAASAAAGRSMAEVKHVVV